MFVGWLDRDGRNLRRPNASVMLSALDPYHARARSGEREDASTVLVQCDRDMPLQFRNDEVPTECSDTGDVLVGWLRLDNRSVLLAELGLSSGQAAVTSDARVVLLGFRAWGVEVANRLEGEFAFAIWQPRSRQVYLARDTSGCRPLFYSVTPSAVAFGSSLAALRGLPGVDDRPDDLWLARFLVGHDPTPGDVTTAFRGVSRLLPATWAMIDHNGATTHKYHAFVDDSPWEDTRDPHWLTTYRSQLERIVAGYSATDAPLGMEASGGLDSSTIVALAAKAWPEARGRMHTFGWAYSEREVELSMAPSRLWQVGANHFYTRWDGPPGVTAADKERWTIRALGHPHAFSNTQSYWPLYAEAKLQGVRVLLSGYGGDEAVTAQADQALTEFADHHHWLRIAREHAGRRVLRPARAGKLLIRGPRNLEQYLVQVRSQVSQGDAWLRGVLCDDMAAELIDRERATRSQLPYLSADAARTVNTYVLLGVNSALGYPRREEGAAIAASFGFDYRWPLLDRRLIQTYLSTPTIWKYGQGMGRYLHRRAVEGIVPDGIRLTNTKNMGAMISAAPGEEYVRPVVQAPKYADLHPALQALLKPVDLDAKAREISGIGFHSWSQLPEHARRLNDWLNQR